MSYCTVDDLRAEGFKQEDYSDEQLERLIAASCEFIDRITGQWFELRGKVIRLDGRGGENLPLPVFLAELHSIKVNHEEISNYVLYNRMEDRMYPKIFRYAKWPVGRLNIEIIGRWGYVKEDGTTPDDIKRAAMKIAMYYFPALSNSEAQKERNLRGLLVSEHTDGHSYSLSGSTVADLYKNIITGDTEVDDILRRYMRTGVRMRCV